MLINGEKFACEACVRGHRVSSCTHSDRKLLHVNKKGRPVSQCQHCRSLRKARSQHVRCECHDKAHAKEDCPHLKTESGIALLEALQPNSTTGAKTAEPHVCCCGHGARCTCALKKDLLESVPEDFPQIIQPKEHHKHRISSLNNHEGKPTVFTNGHHKPVHKINDAHNHCGAPYRVPSRSHTISGGHRDHRELAQRSTDSLPTLKHSTRPTESPLHFSVTSNPQESRKTKSEHNSPEVGPVNPITNDLKNELYIPPLSPHGYSYSPFESQSPAIPIGGDSHALHLPEKFPESWFTTYDEAHNLDQPAVSANGLSDVPPVDWSAYDFDARSIARNFAPVQSAFVPNQLASYKPCFDQLGYSSLHRMNSSSGDLSEADESSIHRPSNLRTVSNASNDISSPGDDHSENYRLSSASSFFGTPQANMLAGNLDNLDIDEYVHQAINEQKRLNSQTSIPTQVHMHPSPPSMRQSPQNQSSPQHVSQIQQPSPPTTQPSPPQQEPSPPATHRSSMGYIMPVNPYGTEHAFTISEAQAYAHMIEDGQLTDGKRPRVVTRTSLSTEDPMWCGTPDGLPAFKLDDEREDEDWVR